MKIDGKDIADWGLKVMRYEGLLNLPSRREPTHYDWGDIIAPLTDEGDIHFNPHTFSVAMFYEKNQELLKSPLKKYKVQSKGGYAAAPFSGWADLLDSDGNLVCGSDKGYNIFTIEAGLWEGRSYELSHGQGPEDMAEYLKSLPEGKTVIIATFDEPQAGRLQEGLLEALYNSGASKEIFASHNFKGYSSYVLMGKKGIGEGKGDERYRGAIEKDPNAWIDADFYIQDDKIILSEADRAPLSLEELLEWLYPLIRWEFKVETPYKNTRAKVKQIKDIKSFQGGRAGRFILEFEEERQPFYSYPENLIKVHQGGLCVDHYLLEENFSLILEVFQEESPNFKKSAARAYQEQTSALKEEPQVHLKLSGVYPGLDVLVEKIERFKALLACPGMRVISYKGYDYYGYLISGIKIRTPREDIAQLEFSLKINDKIRTCHAYL